MNPEENKQPGLIVLSIVMLVLPVLAVFFRCWAVIIMPTHKFGLDDFFAILTLPFIIAQTALYYWWISLGLGRHAQTVPIPDLLETPKIIWGGSFLYNTNISLPKFSALFFYNRVFEKTSRWFSIILRVVGSLNAAWFVTAQMVHIFQCTPIEKAWSTIKGGHCLPQTGVLVGTGVLSLVIDLLILIMPLPLLWRLHVGTVRKLLLTGAFLSSYCVIVISIGRLVTITQTGTSLEEDITWSTVPFAEWVLCEGPVSLISVCLPTMFSLGKRVHHHGLRSMLKRGNIRSNIPLVDRGANFKGNSSVMDVYTQGEARWRESEVDLEMSRPSRATSSSPLDQDKSSDK